MNHPEVLFVPALMLLDHFLTVWGAVLRDRKHSQHFKLTHYELNPVWQKTIAAKKWFNLRHALLVIFVSSYLVFMVYIGVPDEIVDAFLGCLIVLFAMLVGRHISNLLIFGYYARNPDAISGQVVMSHPLVVATSAFQYLTVLVPVIFIAICTDSAFVYGGAVGLGLSLVTHYFWWRKAKKANRAITVSPPPFVPGKNPGEG